MLLIVEDYEHFAEALAKQLRFAEHPFEIAGSATEARARFDERGRDAWTGLLVDPGLPEGSEAGVDFLRWVRPRVPGVPTVCVSGQLTVELLTSVNKLGVQFVTKTDTIDQLPWFFSRVSRYVRTRPDAIAARAAHDYDLTQAETRFVAWFIEGGTIDGYLEREGVGRSTYDKHRRTTLQKTGDADHVRLAIRLWRAALDELVA